MSEVKKMLQDYYELEGHEDLDTDLKRMELALVAVKNAAPSDQMKAWYLEFMDHCFQFLNSRSPDHFENFYWEVANYYLQFGNFIKSKHLVYKLRDHLETKLPSKFKLLLAELLVAEGNTFAANQFLERIDQSELESNLKDRQLILRSKINRLHHQWEQALADLDQLTDPAISEWERATVEWIINKDLSLLAPLTKKGKKCSGTLHKLELWLRMFGCLKHKFHHRVQSPKNIRRSVFLGNKETLQVHLLLRLCERIEKIEEDPTQLHLKEVMELKIIILQISDPEYQLLCMSALMVISERLNNSPLHAIIKDEYIRLASTLSSDELSDPLQLGIHQDSIVYSRYLHKSFENEYIAPIQTRDRIMLSSKLLLTAAEYKVKSIFQGENKINDLKAKAIENFTAALIKYSVKLGPTLQKILQLGIGVEDVLPTKIKEKITDSMYTARILKPKEVKDTLENQLQSDLFDHFDAFDLEPIAAGSIGQVHSAHLKEGEKVAVKILYPNIISRINEDFSAIIRIKHLINIAFPSQDIKAIISKTKETLLSECNFEDEIATQVKAAEVYANEKYIKVPRCIPHLSNKKFLTSEYIQGLRLREIIEQGDQELRDHVGRMIFRSVFVGFKHYFFPCDIHEGNFLVKDRDVYRLDFGNNVPEQEIKDFNLLEVVRLATRKDYQGLQDFLEPFGYFENPNINAQEFIRSLIDHQLKPFSCGRRFRFNQEFAESVFKSQIQNSLGPTSIKFHISHYQVLRFYWSLYSLLARLESEANWAEEIESIDPIRSVA